MIAFSSEFLSPFESWARFGVGSGVVMSSRSELRGIRTTLVARRTLIEVDARRARIEVVVRVAVDADLRTSPPIDPVESTNVITLLAKKPSTRPKLRISEQVEDGDSFSSLLFQEHRSTAGCTTTAEKRSRDRLSIADRMISCNRVLTRLAAVETPTVLEYWATPRIPGGIAKYVAKVGDPVVQTTAAAVTSFQIKK